MNDDGDAGNDEDLTVLDDRLLAGLLLKVHVCIHRLPASAENPETKTCELADVVRFFYVRNNCRLCAELFDNDRIIYL